MPSSPRRRSRSVAPVLYFNRRATFTCLALARPRPIGSTPSMVGDPSSAPLTLAYASTAERDRTGYGYNRTRFAPSSVRRLRGGGSPESLAQRGSQIPADLPHIADRLVSDPPE